MHFKKRSDSLVPNSKLQISHQNFVTLLRLWGHMSTFGFRGLGGLQFSVGWTSVTGGAVVPPPPSSSSQLAASHHDESTPTLMTLSSVQHGCCFHGKLQSTPPPTANAACMSGRPQRVAELPSGCRSCVAGNCRMQALSFPFPKKMPQQLVFRCSH